MCRLHVAKHLFVLGGFSPHCPIPHGAIFLHQFLHSCFNLGADHCRRLHKIDIGKLHAGPRDGIVRLVVRKILGRPLTLWSLYDIWASMKNSVENQGKLTLWVTIISELVFPVNCFLYFIFFSCELPRFLAGIVLTLNYIMINWYDWNVTYITWFRHEANTLGSSHCRKTRNGSKFIFIYTGPR